MAVYHSLPCMSTALVTVHNTIKEVWANQSEVIPDPKQVVRDREGALTLVTRR